MSDVIVDQAVYRDGHRMPCGDLSDELEGLRRAGHGFIWIGLKDPTDAEFALVNEELKLPALAIEDAVKGNQRPKLDVYDNTMFLSLKTLRYIDATSDVETGEVMILVGDRFVVTVRRGEANPLTGVRARLEDAPEHLAQRPIAVLYSVMNSIVDNYTLIDSELSEDLARIEQQVFSGVRGVDSADISDHLLRVIDHVESYDRLLTEVLNAHLAQISVQQDNDMRRISAWVAMAAVPTMVAGIYGMNFHNIPELEASVHANGYEFQYGYFLVLGLLVVVELALFRAFKKSGWMQPVSSAQVALSQPAPRTTNRTSPRATRYQTNVVIGWCATNLNNQAMLA